MIVHNDRIRRIRLLTATVLALVLGIAGCQSTPRPQAGPHPVWPAEGTPRIRHVRDIRGPDDLGRPGLFERIGEAIAGRQRHVMVRPQSIAVAGDRLWVVDQELQGVHVLRFGSAKGGFLDRAGDTYFVSPVGIAWCGNQLAISDSALNKVFLLDEKGRLRGAIEKSGGFKRPTGLAYDAKRNWLHVVDTLAGEVNTFDMKSRNLVRTIGRPGNGPGDLHFPTYVTTAPDGSILVTDSLNFRVQAFDPDGNPSFNFGKAGNASGYLAVPKGVGLDSGGHIYIVDSYLSAVQIFDRQGQLLLTFGELGDARGQFQVPAGLAISGDRIFVCDSQNSRVQVFDYLGGPSDDTARSKPNR